jgi:hypothetical protein
MDFKGLAEWIEASVCASCKQGYTCDEYDCAQARKIAELLKKMVPFKGTGEDGKQVKGWLVPE